MGAEVGARGLGVTGASSSRFPRRRRRRQTTAASPMTPAARRSTVGGSGTETETDAGVGSGSERTEFGVGFCETAAPESPRRW